MAAVSLLRLVQDVAPEVVPAPSHEHSHDADHAKSTAEELLAMANEQLRESAARGENPSSTQLPPGYVIEQQAPAARGKPIEVWRPLWALMEWLPLSVACFLAAFVVWFLALLAA